MASYNVRTLDLSAVVESAELEPANRLVDSLAVLELPSGADLELSLGGGPWIPVYAGFAVDICPPELAGVTWRNNAVVAGAAVVLVSYGGLTVGGL